LHYQTSCEENGLTTGREHKCVLFNEAENYWHYIASVVWQSWNYTDII
jgi:hypothetical protein